MVWCHYFTVISRLVKSCSYLQLIPSCFVVRGYLLFIKVVGIHTSLVLFGNLALDLLRLTTL